MEIFGVSVSKFIYAPLAYLLWVGILLSVKKIVFLQLTKAAQLSKTQLDDVIIDALNFPVVLMIFVSGSLILNRLLPLNTDIELKNFFVGVFKTTTVVAIVLFVEKILAGIIQLYADRIEVLHTSKITVKRFVKIVVVGIGVLILLDSFGVSITPIIASLGIGSLAVALALQPTLENFFSGIQILADKPIKIGQFVKLETGEEGYVQKVGWRSTWISMLAGNVVIVPNKTLVNSRVLNYYYPQKDLAVLVEVGVHYDSDLEKVEKVTAEVAQSVMKEITGGVPEFKPFIRYHTFSEYSIDFTVILRAQEFVDNYLIKHEFIKRLHQRYAKEGICIPYPIRAVNYSQEKAV